MRISDGIILCGKIWDRSPARYSTTTINGEVRTICNDDAICRTGVEEKPLNQRQLKKRFRAGAYLKSKPEIFIIHPDQGDNDNEEQKDELKKATSFTTVVWSFHQ